MSDIEKKIDIKQFVPFLTVIISLLLISKLPTYSFKKISIPSKLTIFILFGVGISFVSLLFFTFETLLIFGIVYFITIPISFYTYLQNDKKNVSANVEDEHEDIL